MDGAAGPARADDPVLGRRQQPLDLAELGVGGLQLGRPSAQDVEPVVVAGRHLVREAAEVEGERGDLPGQLVAAPVQLLERARAGQRAHPISSKAEPPPAGLLSLAGSLPLPVEIGLPFLTASSTAFLLVRLLTETEPLGASVVVFEVVSSLAFAVDGLRDDELPPPAVAAGGAAVAGAAAPSSLMTCGAGVAAAGVDALPVAQCPRSRPINNINTSSDVSARRPALACRRALSPR